MEKTYKETLKAICIVVNNEKNIKGIVKFEDNGETTTIKCTFTGLPEGKHGIHIHEFGNLSDGCNSAGAHFNPYKKDHGGPDDEERHIGDLGNITADKDGNAHLEIVDKLVKLSGPHSVLGRSIVCHENEDDLGRGGHKDSKTTGNSGPRIACGIIGTTIKF